MSGLKKDIKTPGISRRSFLKTAGLTAGASVLTVGKQPVLRALAVDNKLCRVSDKTEKIYRCICRPNCFGYCALNVHVRNGKVVKTSQASFPDQRYNRICLRGLTHPQRIYSPTRIKYPMKRVGKRGEGKWERISWEQAISYIADGLVGVRKKYGKKAVGWYVSSGSIPGTLNGLLPGSTFRFANLIEATKIDSNFDFGAMAGFKRVYGPPTQAFGDNNEWADITNAKSIFAWAHKLEVASAHHWHFIADAIESGAKLTVIDPNFTGLAAKAHRHVAIRPGSDPALMLSMMQVIIQEEIFDRDFLISHTCAPFLVREDNGHYLRMSDLGVAPTQGSPDANGKPSIIDPYVVWDANSKKLVSVESASESELSGSFDVNGIKVKTAFYLLKERVSSFTPEAATKITEIKPDVIREMARELASVKPAANLLGFGSQAYDNGPSVGHCLATLNALTGNIGKPGTSTGHNTQVYLGVNWGFAFPDGKNLGAVSLPVLFIPELLKKGKMTHKGWEFTPLKALWVSNANPMAAWTDQKFWLREFLPTLDLIVVFEEQMTDTAKQADIVLPGAHWFEYDDLLAGGGTHPYVMWSEKAVEPFFESKSETDILRLLAKKMGLGKYFEKSNIEMIKDAFETPAGIAAGLSVENIRKKESVRWMQEDYVAYNDLKFSTPSGRMEFYCEHPLDLSMQPVPANRRDTERLPSWTPPREAWPEKPLYKKYPLIMMSERSRSRANTQWFSNPWLIELEPEPIIKLNPEDAKLRKIQNGDYVEVFNDRGAVVVKAVISEGIKKGVMSYPKGWQRYQYKQGNFSDLTTKNFDKVGINTSFFDNLADVRKWKGQV